MRSTVAGPAAVLVVTLLTLSVAGWWWKASVEAQANRQTLGESWQQVKEAYPLPETDLSASRLSAEQIEAILQANPFSPLRRALPARGSDASQDDGSASASAIEPRFVYKGRIDLGGRSRAIVEETTSRKTHFLEVGQELAGFKVLDIAENRVVLSNLRTDEQIIITIAAPATSGSKGAVKRLPGAALSESERAAQAKSP
jgi:hypothetical protein